MVGQVKVVGILMAVHGLTVLLAGGGIAALGIYMMTALPGAAGGGAEPYIVGGIYLAGGALFLACGLLNAIAGVRVMAFRNRVFGLVALFSNIPVLMSCYCALTAVGMMVYGLIVLFNPDVVRAFRFVAEGGTPEEAVRKFTPRYGDDRDDYDEMSDPRRQWEEDRRRRRQQDDDLRLDDDEPRG